MAVGTAILDFGASPGGSEAFVDVAYTAIPAGARVEAWVSLAAETADHSIDEHRVETLKITAGNVIEGTGFTIYGEVESGVTSGAYNTDWVYA